MGVIMQADYIGEIIGKLSDLPYKCILFDGPWGIGKTYAINEALEKQENVCNISMFGLQNSQQIYHEVLFQSALTNSKAGKVAEFASEVFNGIASIWDSVSTAKEVLQSVKEKELFLLLSKSFDTLHVIVIDDFERISDKINMEEVLGVVEELKKCNYVKVIIVANIEELQEQNKQIFEKYNEKVIDRIYHITEKPQKINWGNIGIHAGFMHEFLHIHKVKNLRTLQKAQKFYEDVSIYCEKIDNQQFKDEIRLICFAIVVESTDNLYYKKNDSNVQDTLKNALEVVQNELEHRIMRYLQGIRSSGKLVSMMLSYYKNETVLTIEDLEVEYKIFLQAGNKPNFYKTDDEIRRVLPQIEQDIENAKTIGEINRSTDEYEVWSHIIEEDSTHVLEKYRNKIHEMLLDEALMGNEDVLGYSYDLWHLESEKVKEIYIEETNIVRKEIIKNYVDYLKKSTKGKQAFEYSYKLRKYFENSYYRDIIKESIGVLYNRQAFPVDEIDSEQYHTCYNIMSVLYHINHEELLKYCDELSKKCDKMSAHRMNSLVEEIIKA